MENFFRDNCHTRLLLIAFIFHLPFFIFHSHAQTLTPKQEAIIKRYVEHGAQRYSYFEPEWNRALDSALALDSTLAQVWQQKAMPALKAGRNEVGMRWLDKAVQFDPNAYMAYRGFMKCIFTRDYLGAIADFAQADQLQPGAYVMDHPYAFYRGLSYLQLMQYKPAEAALRASIAQRERMQPGAGGHHLDAFYLGITLYEQARYADAEKEFKQALKRYPQFADAHYQLARCLYRLGHPEKGDTAYAEAKKHLAQGYTINEDNAIYRRYPYQLQKEWLR